MHDIRLIRDDPEGFDAALARRGLEPASAKILALDTEGRALTTRIQEAQSRRNEASKAIGQAMGQSDTDKAEQLKAEVAELKQTMPQMEEDGRTVAAKLTAMLETIPNLPADDVPQGEGEEDNVEVSSWGEKREFDFEPSEHADLGPALGMDFETGAKISGARFTFLRGGIARLHRAIAQFMLDRQVNQNGYIECAPPVLVNDAAMYGTDKLPKFAEDSFKTTDGRWLIPTSEVSLTSSVMGEIIDDLAEPIRLTALTPCFRSEAGAAGKMLLCTGDMGFGARKTYDLEVWLPGQGAYREISSCSNTGAFQARRMNARYRPEDGGKKTDFVHTLNGSGLAVGRTLVAVLENYQNEDGSVTVPEALKPYMGGIDKLEAAA